MDKLIIGSHQSVTAPNMLVDTVQNAINDGANTFMFYGTAPQTTKRRAIETFRHQEAHEMMKKNNINKDHVIIHAPYLINLANSIDEEKNKFSRIFFLGEIKRVAELGFSIIVLHPGSHGGSGSAKGIEKLAESLNYIFSVDKSNVKVAIEFMSGKGNEIGSNIQELSYLYSLIEDKNRIGFCLDTCHMHDAGVDLNKFEDFLVEFNQKIGIDKILVIHINDSKNICGSHKDRHENIGFGNIGFENLVSIVHNPKLVNVPKILETPYIGDFSPYKAEILSLKSRVFNPNLKEELSNLSN